MNQIRKANILYIQKPPGGGSVVALFEMIRMLDKNRFNPIVLCYESNRYTNALETLPSRVIYLNPKAEGVIQTSPTGASKRKRSLRIARQLKSFLVDDFKVAKKIKDIINNNAIDIIHHNNEIFLSRQGVLANRKLGVPQVCHYRSLKPYKSDKFNWVIDYWLVKKMDFNIYISNAVQKHYIDNLRVASKKGKVVRDIVDKEKFQKNLVGATSKTEFGFSTSDFVITNIGRITPWKGQDVFIKAIAEVAKENPQVKALVVGPFEKGVGDENFYNGLKQLVSNLQLNNRVVFPGHRDDIPSIIAISDLIVHSAIEPEPQGLVIVEALMAGTPVIVSDAGGAAELIVNNEGGLKVQPNNVAELKNAMLKIMSDWKTRQENVPSILGEFDPVKQIEEIHQVYESLLEKQVNNA